MAELVCNLSTQEAETRGIRVSGQSGLHKAFEASLGYIARSCLKMHPPGKETQNKPKASNRKKANEGWFIGVGCRVQWPSV